MTAESKKVRARLNQLLQTRSISELRDRLTPDFSPIPPKVRNASSIDESSVMRRWSILNNQTSVKKGDCDLLFDPLTQDQMSTYEHNIDKFYRHS
jgi:hypothetical protein